MNQNLTDKRVQKLINEAYWVFRKMYQQCSPDLYYNGCDVELDDDGIEQFVDGTFGHYIVVNQKDYYAVNVDHSIDLFGFNNYKNEEQESGVEVIKFKGNQFAGDETRISVTFQFRSDTGEFIEAFNITCYYATGDSEATDEQLLKIKPEEIDMGSFEYVCSGFNHVFDEN